MARSAVTQKKIIEGLILFVAPLITYALGFATSLIVRAPVIHSVKIEHVSNTHVLANATAKQVVAAWGTPDKVQQNGSLICAIWNSKKAYICYIP